MSYTYSMTRRGYYSWVIRDMVGPPPRWWYEVWWYRHRAEDPPTRLVARFGTDAEAKTALRLLEGANKC